MQYRMRVAVRDIYMIITSIFINDYLPLDDWYRVHFTSLISPMKGKKPRNDFIDLVIPIVIIPNFPILFPNFFNLVFHLFTSFNFKPVDIEMQISNYLHVLTAQHFDRRQSQSELVVQRTASLATATQIAFSFGEQGLKTSTGITVEKDQF